MPTENSGELRSGKEIKAERPSAMPESGVLAVEKPSLNAMPTLSANGMSKAEALAVAWTGIEALAMMRQAKLYRSRATGRVVIELLATDIAKKGFVEK